MDKMILEQYIDACELVKETEEDIRKIRKQRRTIVQDSAKGSMPEFPYAAQNFHLEGLPYTVITNPDRLEKEEKLLEERKKRAEEIKIMAEAFMNTVPSRMQRIIRMKVFNRVSWDEVAAKMGRGSTAESIRKEFDRFMQEK